MAREGAAPMSDTHPSIRAWREKRDQWIGSPLSGDCDALAAALEAESGRAERLASTLEAFACWDDPKVAALARDALERR